MKSGWQTACLGDVLAVLKNGLNCKQDKSGQGQRISRIESISLASFDLGRVGYAEISDQDRSKFRLLKGDILFSHINSPIHVGKTAVFDVDDEVYHGVNLLLMRPTTAVSGAYLELYLKYLFEQGYWLSVCKQSVNQASVNQQDITRVPIAYPTDPEEQRRIVAILDEAFEGIATAKANAEKNLQNASELFAGHLQTVFSQRGHGWVSKTVQQWVESGLLAKPQDGNHGEIHPTKADYVESGVPFIMAADMIEGGVDTEGCRFIARAQASALRIGFAKTGDVLLSHKGTIGRVAILDTTEEYVILTPQVTYYRPLDGNRLFNGFLYYCLLSPEFQAAMNRIAGAGSTRAYIGITRQLDLELTLPPIDVQRETAARLRRIDEASSRLAGVYEAKLAALDELKKALLQQAFTGALTEKSTDKQVAEVA